MDNEDYLMAAKYFSKAWKVFPQNKDAYCLQVISIVQSYTYSLHGFWIDQPIKHNKVQETKFFMEKAIANCQNKDIASLYFFKALLNFHLHNFLECIEDISTAIGKEEDHSAFYYFVRGRAYACMQMLSEAINDLTIALNLDDSIAQAYAYRGQCHYWMNNTKQAFVDFQKLIQTDTNNAQVHVQAGKLLMTTGANEDAIKAFENSEQIQVTGESLYQKARCHIALNQLKEASKIFEQDICDDLLLKIDAQTTDILVVMQD